VTSVAISPDDRVAATGSDDDTARVWSLDGDHVSTVLRGHGGDVTAVALTRDGTLLATSSADRVVRRWEVVSGDLIPRYPGAPTLPDAIAITADGREIRVAGVEVRRYRRIPCASVPQLRAGAELARRQPLRRRAAGSRHSALSHEMDEFTGSGQPHPTQSGDCGVGAIGAHDDLGPARVRRNEPETAGASSAEPNTKSR
jgi:hypothetical protein